MLRTPPTLRFVSRIPRSTAAALLVLASTTASGQAEMVVVTPDHAIDPSAPGLAHVEPHLATHPRRPDHLVAGVIVVSPDRANGPWRCAVLSSFDGGATWSRHDLDVERCIDPWALLLEDGTAVVAAIEVRADTDEDPSFRLHLFRSADGGGHWSDTSLVLGEGFDHQILAATRGDLYLAAQRKRRSPGGQPRHTVNLWRSGDGGRSFRELADVRPSNLALNPTGLALLSDGSLVVSFLDFGHRPGAEPRARGRAWALRSAEPGDGFSEPLFITEECGTRGGFAGYPFLAVHGDRLYHLCVREGFDGLALQSSDDEGETWSAPRRIGTPAGEEDAHVRTPMLAVNGAGTLAVSWYDRSRDPRQACQDVYLTVSTDGGATFPEPLRISRETSCPHTGPNAPVAESWPMGGDYSSLAAGSDGLFHLLWADSRSGLFQIHHAAVRREDP